MAIDERRTDRMIGSVAHIFDWFQHGGWERHHLDPGVADFAFGNPAGDATPRTGRRAPAKRGPTRQGLVRLQVERGGATARRRRRRSDAEPGSTTEPDDIAMTAGAFGALGVTIRALCDVGDEVIFLSPPWFFYELMIHLVGRDAGTRPARRARLRPRRRRRRGRHHAPYPGRHRQQPEQSDRTHLPRSRSWPRSAPCSPRRPTRHGRPIILHLRRVVQPDRLRRHRVPQPRPRLRRDGDHLHVRQDAAGARPADRLRGDDADVPRPRATGFADHGPAAGRRAGASRTRCSSTRSRDLEALSIDIGALQARRDRMVPALPDDGLRGDPARGHVLPHGPLARPRRSRLHGSARRDGGAGPAGHDRRVPGLVPPLADRERRDGRARPGALQEGCGVSLQAPALRVPSARSAGFERV